MWHYHPSRRGGCGEWGAALVLLKLAPCPHVPAFAGGSQRHQRTLSGMLFVLYF